jgi:predicted transposase/invertase (TIGR01784 family)
MRPLLTPKLDFVFKKLFCDDREILTDLINAVLDLPKNRRIRSVQIKNPIILPEEITQKYIILDILATDESDHLYDIEMQARQYDYYSKRTLYYASRIYAGQLDASGEYGNLCPVIGIHFLDYEEFPDHSDFHFCFELRDIRHPELRLTDDMAIHIFELPKFEKIGKVGRPKDAMREWLHFFNHAHEEDKIMRASYYKNPAIHKAFNILETLSADEKNRMLAEIREKALRNERSELSAAKKKGIEEGIIKGESEKAKKTAETLLKMGVLSIEQIAEATELSIEH